MELKSIFSTKLQYRLVSVKSTDDVNKPRWAYTRQYLLLISADVLCFSRGKQIIQEYLRNPSFVTLHRDASLGAGYIRCFSVDRVCKIKCTKTATNTQKRVSNDSFKKSIPEDAVYQNSNSFRGKYLTTLCNSRNNLYTLADCQL